MSARPTGTIKVLSVLFGFKILKSAPKEHPILVSVGTKRFRFAKKAKVCPQKGAKVWLFKTS
jgi:hypothetical protein